MFKPSFTNTTIIQGLLSIFCLSAALSSCKKEHITLPIQEIQTPANCKLNDVLFVDENRGYVAGGVRWQYGVMVQTSDGGETWRLDTVDVTELTRINATQNYVFASSHFTGVVYSMDYGQQWNRTNYQPNEAFQSVYYRDPSFGVVVGGVNYQLGCVYHFNGYSGFPDVVIDSMLHEIMDVCFTDSLTVQAVGYGIAMHSHDGGYTWQPADISGDLFTSLHFPSKNIGYAVGRYGTIIKTSDGGLTWRKLRNGNGIFVSDLPFRDVYFIDDSNGFIVGENSLFWCTEDGGETWVIIDGIPPGNNLSGICIQNKICYISADNGKVFKVDLN